MTEKRKLLIVGGSGLLGKNLGQFGSSDSSVLATGFTNSQALESVQVPLDILHFEAAADLFESHEFDVVINCVGYTNVDKCEINPEASWALNVNAAHLLSILCKETSNKLVHISTDHFWSEDLNPRSEALDSIPMNQYGSNKLSAEKIVLRTNPGSLVIRTNFFGWGPRHKPSIVDWILQQLESKGQVNAFEDVFFSPVSISQLYLAINKLLEVNASGVVNVCANESISKYDFAVLVAEKFGFKAEQVKRVKIGVQGLVAPRPNYLSLDNSLLKSLTGFAPMSIEAMLDELAADTIWRSQLQQMG
jgi:dTDP-4-dehydrorhamnose reductase